MTAPKPHAYLPLKEAAQLVATSPSTLRRWALDGTIPADVLDVVSRKQGSHRKWWAAALWHWHTTGQVHADLPTLVEFLAGYPLPDVEPHSRNYARLVRA